ncbi:MAG TPA: hypothetical protein VEY12_10655 [Thermoplasmata archaeon]|nr:hypothetical protein [Thermoplasmata archaeon]
MQGSSGAVDGTAKPAGPAEETARAKWSRGRKIFAVIGALILVFVGVYVAYGYLNGLPPQVLSVLGRGQAYLDVAFMTVYTPSIPGATDFNVTAMVTFANGWQFPFAWGNVSGTSLPVRFVLSPSDVFRTGPSDGFVYGEAVSGTTRIGVVGPHPPGAFVSLWFMTYSVRQLTAWQGFTQATWLEVDYALAPVSLDFGEPLPVANVSAPVASDLIPAGITDDLNLSVQPGYVLPLDHDIYNASSPWPTFHHALPAVTFRAGSVGNFTASLTSSFQWAKGDNYRVEMTFSGALHGYLTWYWDARFGSLYAVFSP